MLAKHLISILKTLGGKDVPGYVLYPAAYRANFYPAEVYALLTDMALEGKIKISSKRKKYPSNGRESFYSLPAKKAKTKRGSAKLGRVV